MRVFLLSLFVSFYVTSLIPGIVCQADVGFRAFLTNAANAFPSWIAEHGLDPTRESPFELNLEHSEDQINITRLKIWNEVVAGYSSSVTTKMINANLFYKRFEVQIEIKSDFNVTAEYEVEGIVLPSVPITGAGKVITERVDHSDYIYLIVEAFGITQDGYLNMSASQSPYSGFRFYTLYLPSFDNLSAGRFQREVLRILRHEYKSWSMKHVAEYLRLYYEELFAETPFSEIINSTYTTSTTTPISETSE